MFDQKPNSNQSEAPTNLPVGQGPAVQATPGVSNEPEDILADIEVDKGPVSVPAKPATEFSESPRPIEPPKSKTEIKEPFVQKNKKIFVVIFLVLIIGAVLGLAGWYAYNQFIVSPPDLAEQILNNSAINQNIDQNVNQNINQNVEPPAPIDSDRDSLSDEEEAMYGTDPLKADSDSDGLTDRDEAKVFETDPTNPDSDGDGFLDGEEVRNGYDPKGPGKLQ